MLNSTREKLIAQADRLLAERSYNAFSYAHLAGLLGIRKPSVHHHFPRKQDLVTEVVARYAQGFGEFTVRVAERPPRERLEAYFALFAGFVARGHGCPTATLAAEAGALPEDVLEALRGLMRKHVAWLREVLESGRAAGEFRFQGASSDLAMLVASSVQGAILSARGLGVDAYHQCTRQLSALLFPETACSA